MVNNSRFKNRNLQGWELFVVAAITFFGGLALGGILGDILAIILAPIIFLIGVFSGFRNKGQIIKN